MANPRKKQTAGKRLKTEEIELHPDAWERFEAGLKKIVKAPTNAPKSKAKSRPS